MISKSDVSTRRILNFPVIRPCESVAFSSLLNSLIRLCHSISEYKSRTFYTNKRNARNSIRLVEDLRIFLDEIKDGHSRFVNSMALSLSELHFIFQKLLYLLEDCTRDDSRLWMLMKSESVSSHFRVLNRAVAVAIDVLPLEIVDDIGDEVKEVVEFVRKQAMKMKFEQEIHDRRAVEKVLRIVDQFECGFVPEPIELKWVLDHLAIHSWKECNSEVKFLDCEIGLEWQSGEKRDFRVLSSLMFFMIYVRCTLFDVVGSSVRKGESSGGLSSEIIRCLNPEDFRCPITLELMIDPVTILTGHTYDRSSILKWFRAGKSTCPKTGKRLLCTDLVPNLALKGLIRKYCSGNGIGHVESGSKSSDVTRTVAAGSVAAEQGMKLLAIFLVGKLLDGTSEGKNKAAFEIRMLTKTSIFNRSCLVEAGAIPHLLNLLSSRDLMLQENAVACLLNLSKCSESKKMIVDNGGLESIFDVLKQGLKAEARQHAAGVLFYIASVEEYRLMIGQNSKGIPALIELLREGTERGKKNALVTIFGLLTCSLNHRRALEAGLVPLLIREMRSFGREDLVTDSLAVLSSLAERLDGAMTVMQSGALPEIIEILNSSNARASKEYCVSLLLSLCINAGGDAVPLLVQSPSLMEPLYALITQGTPRASKKASSLLKILHDFNEKKSSDSGMRNSALRTGQFIHVW